MDSIHLMNLAGIDLNLLVVFDALMQTRSVTRAGEAIGLSQPAASNALARLRRLTQDELFVRTAAGLQPTPGALALATAIQPALQQIQTALIQRPSFDPSTSDRIFTLGMSDYAELTLLPPLLTTLQATAPQVRLRIRSGDRSRLLSLLDSGELDLACGIFPERVRWHREQALFRETFVCVCRRDHPTIGEELSLETYIAARHLLVSVKEDMVGRVDTYLAAHQLQRHIAASVPHFLVVPFLLAQSDLIATLARRVVNAFTDWQQIKVLPLPIELSGFSLFMRWHSSTDTDPACCWLRSQIQAVSGRL